MGQQAGEKHFRGNEGVHDGKVLLIDDPRGRKCRQRRWREETIDAVGKERIDHGAYDSVGDENERNRMNSKPNGYSNKDQYVSRERQGEGELTQERTPACPGNGDCGDKE